MDRKPYNSDVTDAQWKLLKEFIPEPKPGPQEPKYARREVSHKQSQDVYQDVPLASFDALSRVEALGTSHLRRLAL